MFTEYGPEVFYVGGDKSTYVSADVRNLMITDFGLPIAEYAQVSDVLNRGGEWCATGIFNARSDMGYPTSTELAKISGCGSSVGMQSFTPAGGLGGVHFYGIKPDPDIKSSWPKGAVSVVWRQRDYNGKPENENVVVTFENGHVYNILPFMPAISGVRPSVYHDPAVGFVPLVYYILMILIIVLILSLVGYGIYRVSRGKSSNEPIDEIEA